MTLNITVVSSEHIFQSADFELTNMATRKPIGRYAQKTFVANTLDWSATVSFSGVAEVYNLNVSKWLSDIVHGVKITDSLDDFVEAVRSADDWLTRLPADIDRRQSFTIGAFDGIDSRYILLSNYERPAVRFPKKFDSRLDMYSTTPTKNRVFISGDSAAVSRTMRRRIIAALTPGVDPKDVQQKLCEINREVSQISATVGKGCCSNYISSMGTGATQPFDTPTSLKLDVLGIPGVSGESLMESLNARIGNGKLVQSSFGRTANSKREHLHRLKLDPDNSNHHNSFGAYLQNVEKNLDAAEQEYRKALQLNPENVTAQVNLAGVLCAPDKIWEARELYERAYSDQPENKLVIGKYARFLIDFLDDSNEALRVLTAGILTHKDVLEFRTQRANIHLSRLNGCAGRRDLEVAAQLKGDKRDFVQLLPFALHLTEGPTEDCIIAYKQAIEARPESADHLLNLAQLLFVVGPGEEAHQALDQAFEIGLRASARIEGHFYELAYSDRCLKSVLNDIELLLSERVRLNWNVDMNIRHVSDRSADHGRLLEESARVLGQDYVADEFAKLKAKWECFSNTRVN